MARHSSVADSPNRDQIEKLIAEGKLSYRSIAAQTGVSPAAVKRYADSRMKPAMRKADERRQVKTGESVMDEIDQQLHRLQEMMEAAAKELKGPDGKLSFALNARDADCIYEQTTVDDDGKPRVTRLKATLQELIDKQEGIVSVTVRRDDTRTLYMKLSAAVGDYMERLAKILGMIKPAQTNVLNVDARRQVVNQVSYTFMTDVRTALSKLPAPLAEQAIEAVASHFEKLAETAGDNLEDEGA